MNHTVTEICGTNRVRTVVTGTGMLCSLGYNKNQIWSGITEERMPLCVREYCRSSGIVDRYPVYGIEAEKIEHLLTDSQMEALKEWGLSTDVDMIMLVAVINEAWNQAQLNSVVATREDIRISLVIGHENLGVVSLADHLLNRQPHHTADEEDMMMKQLQQPFFHIQSFPYLFYLSKLFGINGFTYSVNNACASGLYALEMGRQLVASKSTDIVIVACSDYAHISEYLWLKDQGAISPDGTLRPFDKDRNGTVLGDGAGAVVMESVACAVRRGTNASCEYVGGSFAQDTWNLTLPDVRKHTYASVIENAVDLVGEHVDLIVPHGAGSSLWDRYEASEIERAYAQLNMPMSPVTCFKGYTGHTLGASAMLEMLILLRCMEENKIPRTLNYDEEGSKINLPIAKVSVESNIDIVLKAVPAYGGFHAACIFKKV